MSKIFPKYFVILNKGQYFWRAERQGYGNLYDAGIYSRHESEIIERSRPYEDRAIPAKTYKKTLEEIKYKCEELLNFIYEEEAENEN